MLTKTLQAKVSALAEYKMGVHRVTVPLRDGRVFSPVDVAWEREIVRVEGSSEVPFEAEDIIDIVLAPGLDSLT